MKDLPARRPAETTAGAAAAVAVLICSIFGVTDTAIYGALVIIVGFIPTAITWAVVTFKQSKEKS